MIGLWKVGFCSFTCRPYQFASDEGICCKLATIAPCWGRGHLAGHPTHEMSLRRILLAHCQSSSPCFRCFDQSVMMFVNRMVRPRGIGSQNVQKIAAEESWWRWREMVVLKLVRSYRLHSGDICDFYETFENISRFIAQIQSSFSTHFPFKCRQTVIVFTSSQSGCFPFVCSKYSLIKPDLGILNPPCCRALFGKTTQFWYLEDNQVLQINEQLVK